MKPQTSLSPEASHELPVEQMYNQSVTEFIRLHAQLAQLPQDRNDPLASVDSLLRGMGVERDNDMSMFVMGGLGKAGIETAAHAFGAALSGGATMAADIGLTMALEHDSNRRNEAPRRPAFKRDANARSIFSRYADRRAPVAAPQKAKSRDFASAMLMSASTLRAPSLKETMKKREMLKASMDKCRADIELLDVFKKSGYKFARRLTKKDKTGQNVSLLVPVEAAPSNVLTAKTRTRLDVDNNFKMPGMRGPGGLSMAA